MPDWENNAYSNPQNLGLTLVASKELSGYSYEFDLVILLQDQDGTLWAAHDSGCSCPTPFEDHTFPTDFVQVRSEDDVESLISHANHGTAMQFRREVRQILDGN